MEFDKLTQEIKSLSLDTLRMDCDNYFEAVLLKDEIGNLVRRLEVFFGLPAWPSKNRLPFQVQQTINGFGGITAGQTLYFCNEQGANTYAMLWPWRDGEHATLKIIKK